MSSGEDWRTLGQELEELERTDPVVGEAARRLYEVVGGIVARGDVKRKRFHKSGPDHPMQVEEE